MDLKNLKKGEFITDKLAVLKVEEKQTRQGKPFLLAELSHASGLIVGKVWEDALNNALLKSGRAYRITAQVDSYRDEVNLNISQATPLDEEIDQYLASRSTMVFDIETAGKAFEDLEEWDQNYLLHTLQRQAKTEKEAKQATGLYPLYGQVVAIGMYNPVSQNGMVYVLSAKKTTLKPENKDFKYQVFEKESQLLEAFWQTANKYERFVTYNGTGFDFPFLAFRSAFNQIKVPFEIHSRQDFHIDLMYKFSGGNTYHAYKLEALCRAFGISNPKAKGVSGLHVSKLFEKGKYQEIADYVARDAHATSQLYQIWRNFMAGRIVI
ncbi:hypothetical protein GYA49_06395 [Candidatus Beckwithbacteria bacterium]|nr:hypothetical protein [Candidatus Beckwithbacteria bacterium]